VGLLNEELKVKLEQAYRILYMEGMADDTTRGHMTAKADDGTIYIKPWGMGFEEVTVRDFLGMDAAGNITEGEGRLHSEILLHLEIYRRRKDVISVTHVHPLYAVLLSSVFQGRLYMIGQHCLHFGGQVPFYESAKLIHSQEQAAKLADLLADGPAVLMRNHGVVTAGKSIEEAAIMAIDFEKAAREHLAVSPIGEPMEMRKDELEKMREVICNTRQYTMLWNYYCRKIDRMKNIIF
jgi:ribulose-5-phosphate 4-epimerase/fuculose-1-phosphate aldolase